MLKTVTTPAKSTATGRPCHREIGDADDVGGTHPLANQGKNGIASACIHAVDIFRDRAGGASVNIAPMITPAKANATGTPGSRRTEQEVISGGIGVRSLKGGGAGKSSGVIVVPVRVFRVLDPFLQPL
jgi:hypothetical protein